MASIRRAAFDVSRLAKQVTTGARLSACRVTVQARSVMSQQSTLLKRNMSEMSVVNQAHKQYFSIMPKIASSALLTTIPALGSNLLTASGSGSSDVLEGSGGDDEGLVTPAYDPVEDL